jgi:hypothetical protein
LRGEVHKADAYRKESYEIMVAVTGPPDQWQRNQFY